MKNQIKIMLRMIGVILLLGILYSYAMFQGGFVSWFLFYGFLPVAIYQLLFACYPVRNWRVYREIADAAGQAGEEIQVTVHIKRKIPFPLLYCIVEEQIPPSLMKEDTQKEKYHAPSLPAMQVNRKQIRMLFPLFRRHVTFTYALQHLPRGEHKLEKLTIRTGEVFGFIKKKHDFPVTNQLTVYPYTHDLVLINDSASYEQGEAVSNPLQQIQTNIVSGVREYAPGDRVTWIDWKQTAKKQSMMTKEFDREKSTEIVVIHDNCGMDPVHQLIYEASIEMSSSLLEKLCKRNDQIGFLSIGEKAHFFNLTDRDVRDPSLKKYLLTANPESNQAFSIRFREEMSRMSRVDSAYLILSSLDGFLVQAILRTKQRVKHLSVLYLHEEEQLTEEAGQLLRPLRFSNIHVQTLALKKLSEDPVEVNVT